MPLFPEEWIHELHAKVNIVDLVGEYVTLQNKSGRWWACCPFHNEKTPSFTVNADKGFFHCFGCGKGGNAIHFVMELEKMTFPEACEFLAEKVHLALPEKTDDSNYQKKKALREKILRINKQTAQFFYANLNSGNEPAALEYLKGRDLGAPVIKTFGIGFAQDSWDSLIKMLEGEGYTQKDILDAGLAKSGEGKFYDAFRNRIIMPIINAFGEVIGFGGRVMDDSMPKYLNSPETAVFNKSRNLYNLNLVKKIRNIQFLILVEGYMDVIAMYAHGIKNCVATLGTALTKEQARLIKRYTNTVFISYDGDGAGQKAALRAVDILEAEQVECRVVAIPQGQDPDDFLKQHKKEGYEKLLKQARTAMDYKFDQAAAKYNLDDGAEMEKYAHECIEMLKQVQSAVIKEKYVKNLAGRTGFSVHSITQDVGIAVKEKNQNAAAKPVAKPRKLTAAAKAENYVTALACANPEKAMELERRLTGDDFYEETNKKMFLYILQCAKRGFTPNGDEILSVLTTEEELNHATRLLSSSADLFTNGKNADSYLSDCVKRMKMRSMESELDACIREVGNEKDATARSKIVERISSLTKELYQLRTKASDSEE